MRKLPYILLVSLVALNIVVFGLNTSRDANTQKINAANATINDAKMKAADQDAERLMSLNHKYKDKKWYCIGDSVTSNNLYQGKVSELCRFKSVVTDGQPLAGMATMADHVTPQNLAEIDLVTVFAGMYDFGGNTELGTRNDDKTVNTFYGNIEKVIDKIAIINPKAKLIFITPLKIGKSQYGVIYPTSNAAGYSLSQYSQAIQEVCLRHQIQVIDLFNQSGIDYNGLLNQSSVSIDQLTKVIVDELERNKDGVHAQTQEIIQS